LPTIMFGLVSCSFLVINLIRNYSLSGTLTGHRKPGISPLSDNIYYCGKAVISWFLPSTEEPNIPFAFGFGVAILLLVLFTIVLIKNVFNSSAFHSTENIALTFSFVYFCFMIISATVSRYEEIDYRLMSPLFIPLTLGLGGMVIKSSGDINRSRRKWVVAIAVLLAGVFEINQIMSFSTLPNQDSYAGNEWRVSSIVNYLKGHQNIFGKGDMLISNSNYAMYFFAGLDADPLPDREYPFDVQSFYNRQNIYLIWFTRDENEGDLTLDEILTNKPMTLVKEFDDGWIYRSNEEVLKK
jgi:hypothetical protein